MTNARSIELSMGGRKAVTNKMAAAYRRGGHSRKGGDPRPAGRAHTVASRPCEGTSSSGGRDTRSARKGFSHPAYPPRVLSAPERCWRVARALAGKRLAAMVSVLVPRLRRDGELDPTDDEAVLLCQVGPATIDRRLQGARARAPDAQCSARLRRHPQVSVAIFQDLRRTRSSPPCANEFRTTS